jgi:hypothetical protein
MKLLFLILLSIIIVWLVSGCRLDNAKNKNVSPMPTPTEVKDDQSQKLDKTFKDFLANELKDMKFKIEDEKLYYSYEDFKDAFLIDVDNDKNNELVALYKHKQYIQYKVVIFKYENNKINSLIELNGLGGKGYDGYSIIEDQQGKKYILNNGFDGRALEWSEWFTLSELNGNKLEIKNKINFTKELVFKGNKPTNEWSYKFIQNDKLIETGVMKEIASSDERSTGKYLIEKEKIKSLKMLFEGEKFENYNLKGENIK